MSENTLTLGNSPFRKDAHFLLAMSGGVDSCVLFDLFLQNKISFSVAHVNYGLRNSANQDQEFVEQICRENRVPCFVKVVENGPPANSSVQQWARDVRYGFMHEILLTHPPDIIVTAHHLDDSLETFFINFARSTGIAGLLGISDEEKIWRPLLRFTKDEIVQYAVQNKIAWREDESNAGTAYLRNQIRWNLIPPLKEIAPNIEKIFEQNIDKWREDYEIFQQAIEQKRGKLFKSNGEFEQISIEKLKKLKPLKSWVFHLFRNYGFNHAEEVIKLMDSHTGSEMQSESHRLLKDRDFLMLRPLEENMPKIWKIKNFNSKKEIDKLPFYFEVLDSKIDESNQSAVWLDYNKLIFPLLLKAPTKMESLRPAGMQHKSKKVGKFLKDIKLSKFEKEGVLALYNGDGTIAALDILRADERFAPTDKTEKWLKISQK